MESFRPPSYPALYGDLAYAAALALLVYLQKVGVRLRSEETWWASNGRDVINGFAAISVSIGIWLQGLAPWLALFLGCSLTLALSIVHAMAMRRHPQPWKPVVAAALLLGAPLVVMPRPIAEATAALLQAGFGSVLPLPPGGGSAG